MKLSEQTLTVLKNFATINPSVVFKPGNELRTISPQKTVMSVATVPDEFPIQACVYDMSRFLSMCSLYENPEIDFNDNKFCHIKDGKRKTKYVFADISMVIVPPEKEIKIPSEDVSVDVEWDDIQSVLKAAGVLNLPEIAFVGRDGICYLSAVDSANPTADSHEIEIGKTEDTFQLVIKTENLKLIPQKYKVTLCSKGISKFEGNNIRYFIAIESKSTYKKG
jgi:hypothetical protein